MEVKSKSKRQLAAILFADIVGYTSMMQEDEGKAMGRLAHYQEVLQSQIAEYDGQVIKNYGDGSICIFSDTKSAVFCARDIQTLLQNNEPMVPLRIGLHLGDVIFKDDDVYGNAINLASRLESIGEAGSVLVSEDIYRKTKNQKELEFHSLGTFELKNVEQPMEVFAMVNEGLTIPDHKALKNKLKAKQLKKSFEWKKVLLPAALLLIMGLMYSYFNTEQKSQEPEQSTQFKNKQTPISKASIRNQ